MKLFKKIAAGLLAIAMAISIAPISAVPVQADDPAVEGNPLRLWYDKPASQGTNILSAGANYSDADGSNTWQQQTLPIGNGDMGANVYGEIVSEHLTFNEKTLWTGGPSTSRPDYMGGNIESKGNSGYWLKEIQQQFLEGNTSYASQLCGTYLVGSSDGYGSYQPWGDIYFDYKDISADVTNYQRDLDLTTALSTVSFTEGGTDYYREFFISHDDNVLVGRLEADGDATLNLDVRFTSKQGGTTVVSGNNTLVLNGELSDNQMKYSSYLTVDTEGGTVTAADGKLTITGATAVTVYLSAATDYQNTFYDETGTDDYYYRTGETADELYARVRADVDAAVAKGYDAVKADHLTDYQELFSRLSLDLGQTVSDKTTDQLLAAYKNGTASTAEQRQLEVMLFQYGRYLTIASSREDSQLPSNLQGVWNCLNNPPWASDYHMNVNLQMNYWPTYSTNLAECALPLIDYVDSLREPGRVTAQVYFGVGTGADEATGFTAHTQNTPFGWTCPGWSFDWGWSPAAVPWILQNCWEYYEYTGDVEFMCEYLYPMMKEQAIFYDATMVRDGDGKLVSAPSYSPEHGPRTAGNTYEQSLAWQLYEDTIIAAETLDVDADLVAQWKQNQADLKGPIEIGESGQLKEWYEETTITSMDSQGADAAGHRHISHMLGLFPGDLVQQNEEWIAAARVSMEYRTDNSTGWGMGQRINTWARLGDGNKAHELIQNLFQNGIYPNMWDAHAPFQIDGNFGMTSGVAEMLMQSNMGYINLLPALPDVWAEGSVDGLVARGNFEIAMDWTKGGVTNATILSNNGGEAVVLADNIALATVTDSKGNAVAVTKTEDGMISFDTVQGETYTLTIPERPEAPTNLVGVREALEVVSLTWDAIEGENVTYNVYRQSDSASPVEIASGLTETAYTDNALDTEANVVTYMVTAEVDGLESIYSNTVEVTAPATRGMIDNLDERIIYEGGWSNWSESVNYNGSIMYLEGSNYQESATVTLQFIGTGIEIYTCTNYDRNYFEVFIDGESYGDVDTYSAQTVRQVKVFTESELEYGLHTLVIKPLAKRNSAASGTGKLELDAFNILAVDVVEVNIAVGETAEYTDESGYYVDADTSALDESIATVEVTGNVTSSVEGLSENVTAIESGKTYVLYNKVAQKLMNNESADASYGGGSTGLALSSTKDNFQDKDLWTITAVDGGYYVQDMNGKYLTVASGSAGVTETATVISLAYDGTDWTIGQSGQYLNDYGGIHTVVAGWSDINDGNSQWEVYERTTIKDGTTTLTFTGVAPGSTSVQVANVLYKVKVTEAGHICVFDQEVAEERYLAAEADCEHAATYYYSCECGEKGTETFEAGEALGHDYADGICTRCGELLGVIRLAGSHRWNTALKVADEMKANLDVEKFDAIIIASGNGFADALAGSYLSTVKNAPILLSWGNGGKFEYLDTDNIDYIKANLAEAGVVYLLGGTSAVPELYETELSDYEVKRLGGKDRFETNLMILEEAGVAAGSEVLVCTSTNFADSLSASATGLPILLVFNEKGILYGEQPEYLAGLENCTFTVIGGENAVSADLAAAIGEYGDVERLAGGNRFETSVLVAEKYFEAPETAVLAYAWNYPDGLCGGALAYSMNAPLVLTMTNYEAQAVAYAESVGLTTGIVLGGDSLISDAAVRAIFAMDAAAEIIVK